MILVDTGNTTQNNIISEEFFLLTGLLLVQSDALSRSEHLPKPTQEECEEAEELLDDEVVIKFTDPAGKVNNLVSDEISAADLQAAQKADPVI